MYVRRWAKGIGYKFCLEFFFDHSNFVSSLKHNPQNLNLSNPGRFSVRRLLPRGNSIYIAPALK